MVEPAHVGRAALVALGVDPLLHGAVAERDHAALAGGQLLVRIEAEHGRVPASADRRAVRVERAEGLAGVLDDRQPEPLEGRDVGGIAEDVDREQRRRALGDRGGRGGRVEVQGQRVDVREHRRRALVEAHVGAGDERERRRDHLVPFADADGAQAQVQAGRPAGDGARMRRADACGERALELRHARPERELAGAQHLDHRVLLGLPQDRPCERDLLLAHADSAAALRAAAPRSRRRPCSGYSSESTSACHEAAMTFSPTPIVPQTSFPSEASISTRVMAPVAVALVEDADLVVHELDLAEVRVDHRDGAAQRGVEGVDGAVALRGAHVALPVDPDLDRRLGLDLPLGALFDDHAPALELEQRLVPAALLAHQQLERPVSRLELVTEVLELLDAVDDPRAALLVQLEPGRLRLLHDGPAAGELGDEHVAPVADQRGIDVLERARVGTDAGGVQARLVRERMLADVRLGRIRGAVQQLVDVVRGRRQQHELLGRQHLMPHLQLQVGDDRDEVRVSRPLADAVHRPLHLGRPGVDGDERVGDGAARVVVGVDAQRDAGERRRRGAHARGDARREAAAVGVAQDEALRARVSGGAQAVDRVVRVGRPPVEEVLGVEDRPLALRDEERDRLGDHREVLLARDAQHLLDVQHGALADERDHGREALGEHPQAVIAVGRDAAPPRHAEADDLGVVEPLTGEQVEQLLLLGVRGRESGLDQVDAEHVEAMHDAHLLLRGEAHAPAAHAVAERGVVELDRGCHGKVLSGGGGDGWAAARAQRARRPRIRRPASLTPHRSHRPGPPPRPRRRAPGRATRGSGRPARTARPRRSPEPPA